MKITIIILILGFVLSKGIAQVPDNPEDISPLLISERVPEISIKSIDGESVSIVELLKGKKSVLLFYRGGWCPYCNAHLSAVGEVEEEILTLGYQIIAISPDSPDQLKATIEKQKLNYTLYSDASGVLMESMGIAFKAPERYDKRLDSYSDGLNPGLLPVPSLFVIDSEGIIIFEYINPDYKHRISSGMLLAILDQLGKVK
jgi:peroxiredoxin